MAYGSYHPIVKIGEVSSESNELVRIYGNICETGDVFTPDDREMPPLREGDVLAIMVAGAYGYSMASFYNTRPRPAEILVSGKKMKVIRKADKIADLL